MMNPRPTLLPILVLLAATGPVAVAEHDPGLTPVPERPPAPAYDLLDADERRHRLGDLRGQPAIINFWATWCPPCRAEMPAMERAWTQLRPDGIRMIAINVGEDPETVRTFREEIQVSFPLPLDTDSKVSQRWPMRGLPTTFVLDPTGRIAYKAEGERAWDDPRIIEQVRALATDTGGAQAATTP